MKASDFERPKPECWTNARDKTIIPISLGSSLESMCCEEMNLKSSPVNFAKAVAVVVAQIDKGGGWGVKKVR